MKARAILFAGAMVRALLDGRKTQTRRIVKGDKPGQPLDWLAAGFTPEVVADPDNSLCPYGVPGDLLWARETWCPAGTANGAAYCADAPAGSDQRGMGWRPSIHMPRWANRLTLEITDVRVERLQDISEADAAAEGVEPPAGERGEHDWSICPKCGGTGLHGALGANLGFMEVDCVDCDTHAKRYRHLWNHINGATAWDENPWVWAVTFEVHQQNIDAFLKAREAA